MSEDFLRTLLPEYGPWTALVFYLLWRDYQKDQATREALSRTTHVLVELTTLIRERLPRPGDRSPPVH